MVNIIRNRRESSQLSWLTQVLVHNFFCVNIESVERQQHNCYCFHTKTFHNIPVNSSKIFSPHGRVQMDHQLMYEENSTLTLHSTQQDGGPVSKPEPWNNCNYSPTLEFYADSKPALATERDSNALSNDANAFPYAADLSPRTLNLYLHDHMFPMAAESKETVTIEPDVIPKDGDTSNSKLPVSSESAKGRRESGQRPSKRERTGDQHGTAAKGDEQTRPTMSYVAMIYQAIQESPTKLLSLNEIYTSITKRYPFFRDNHKGWQNSIRHNLSLNDCFVKHPREPGAGERKGCYWGIDQSAKDMYKDGYQRRRRMKRTSNYRLNHVVSTFTDLALQQTGPYCNGAAHFPYQNGAHNIPPASYIYSPYIPQNYPKLNGPAAATVNPGTPFSSTLANQNNRVMTLPHSSNSAFAQHCSANTAYHPLNPASHANMLQSWAASFNSGLQPFVHAPLANFYTAHTGAHGSTGYSAVPSLSPVIATSTSMGRFQYPVASTAKFIHSTR